MSQGEFRPESTPLFEEDDSGAWWPSIDVGTGRQKQEWLATRHQLVWPGGPDNSAITAQTWFSMSHGWAGDIGGHIWVFGSNQNLLYQEDFVLLSDKRKRCHVPANTELISVEFASGRTESVAWCLEKKGKPA